MTDGQKRQPRSTLTPTTRRAAWRQSSATTLRLRLQTRNIRATHTSMTRTETRRSYSLNTAATKRHGRATGKSRRLGTTWWRVYRLVPWCMNTASWQSSSPRCLQRTASAQRLPATTRAAWLCMWTTDTMTRRRSISTSVSLLHTTRLPAILHQWWWRTRYGTMTHRQTYWARLGDSITWNGKSVTTSSWT